MENGKKKKMKMSGDWMTPYEKSLEEVDKSGLMTNKILNMKKK